MSSHTIASVDEFDEDDRLLVNLEGRGIAIFRVDGEFHAYTNWCAHQAGPICEGSLSGTQQAQFDADSLEMNVEWTREGKILNCPWHGWEYDVETGDCLSSECEDVSLIEHKVRIEDGNVVVDI